MLRCTEDIPPTMYDPPETADRYRALDSPCSILFFWSTCSAPSANDAARMPPPEQQIPTLGPFPPLTIFSCSPLVRLSVRPSYGTPLGRVDGSGEGDARATRDRDPVRARAREQDLVVGEADAFGDSGRVEHEDIPFVLSVEGKRRHLQATQSHHVAIVGPLRSRVVVGVAWTGQLHLEVEDDRPAR